MNKRTLKRAMGVSDGKSLTIANDCAEVFILLENDGGGPRYHLSGDACGEFTDLEKALSAAIKGLAKYMDGSPSR